jgi:hypothetical protein
LLTAGTHSRLPSASTSVPIWRIVALAQTARLAVTVARFQEWQKYRVWREDVGVRMNADDQAMQHKG